jgi:signal peptidase
VGVPGHLQLARQTCRAHLQLATIARWLREGLLSIAAVGGMMSIVAVIVAQSFGLSVVMFRTGSMAPTIPAGAAAVVREVPATEVRVGDIVTVPNPRSSLPVTHRVVAIQPDGDGLDGVTLTLKGDANQQVDPFTYHVREVRKVVASSPALGTLLSVTRSPQALGLTTVAVTILVTWAFWPRATDRARDR